MKLSEFDNGSGELWLQKYLEVTSRKREVMYRFIGQSLQTLVWGNGGGVALLLGFISSGSINQSIHWGIFVTLLLFLTGVILASITLIFTTTVAIKEAHMIETAMYKFLKDEIPREEALIYDEKETFKWVNTTAICGTISAIVFVVGLIFAVVQIALFF